MDNSRELKNKFFGIYRAIVVDNNDPDKTGRLRLLVPLVYGDKIISEWALPASLALTGIQQAHFEVPDIGANVWCMFEAGDPSHPVWLGGWLGKPKVADTPILAQGGTIGAADIAARGGPKGTDVMITAANRSLSEPPSSYATVYPFNRVFVTRNGIKIEIDDTPGAQRISIWHPAQTYFEIHPDGKKVEKIQQQRWITIEGNDRIHVRGGQDIVIEGVATVKIKGGQLETAALIQVEGNCSLLVEGSLQQVVKGDYCLVVGGSIGIMAGNVASFSSTNDMTLSGKPVTIISRNA